MSLHLDPILRVGAVFVAAIAEHRTRPEARRNGAGCIGSKTPRAIVFWKNGRVFALRLPRTEGARPLSEAQLHALAEEFRTRCDRSVSAP